MKGYPFYFVLLLAIGVLTAPTSATAQLGIGLQDPGFSYVDVNNDGYYNPADGDIGPVNQQIMDGYFDTGRSEAGYSAPCYPVSLVVSHSQIITPGVPIFLRAGVNLILFEDRPDPTAPTVTLKAGRNIYMAGTLNGFKTCMTVDAGLDATIDGALFSGSDSTSKLSVSACRDISARPYVHIPTNPLLPLPPPIATNISVGSIVNVCSSGSTYFDGANISVTQAGAVSLSAGNDLEAVNRTNISAFAANITAQSRCGLVRLQNDNLFGKSLDVNACDAAIVDQSLFSISGAVSIEANGPVDGLSLIVSASDFTVCSYDGVDLDSSNIFTGSGDIRVTGQEDVSANSAAWVAAANICVTSRCGDIYVRTADLEASPTGSIQFYAGGGLIDVTGSFIFPFPSYGPNNVTVIGSLRPVR